jgi:Ran GTPase-activating protein (RanGAP) involved in mRNA processing and transport
VYNVERMAVIDCVNNSFDGLSSFTLRKLLSIEDLFKELTSLHHLHDDTVVTLVLKEVYHLNDVWVIDLLHDSNFLHQRSLVFLCHLSF